MILLVPISQILLYNNEWKYKQRCVWDPVVYLLTIDSTKYKITAATSALPRPSATSLRSSVSASNIGVSSQMVQLQPNSTIDDNVTYIVKDNDDVPQHHRRAEKHDAEYYLQPIQRVRSRLRFVSLNSSSLTLPANNEAYRGLTITVS